MPYFDISIFYIICISIILYLLVSLPFFSFADHNLPKDGNHKPGVTGIRGFLALAVLFQHGAMYPNFVRSGVWVDPPRFHFVLGQIGVTIFFMITGYLFWGKLIRENGRINWVGLYIGRIFRIGPAYLISVLAMLSIIFSITGWNAVEPYGNLIREVGSWLALGINGGGPDVVNGHAGASMLMHGVTWTLASEWKFYAVLPILAVLARFPRSRLKFLLVLAVILILYSLLHPEPMRAAPSIRALMFIGGMICASLEGRPVPFGASQHYLSLAGGISLCMVMLFAVTAYAAIPVLCLVIFFYTIIAGGDLFGFLKSKSSIRLGEFSYGIYILQGVVMNSIFSIPYVRELSIISNAHHWLCVLFSSFALIIISSIVFYSVERPGIIIGRLVSSRILLAWNHIIKNIRISKSRLKSKTLQ